MKKTTGNGTLIRSITAMLIVVILVLTISVAASGWQADTNGENSGEDGNLTDNADHVNGDTDKNGGTADNNSQDTEASTKPIVPEYTYYLTGRECNAESVNKLPYAFVMGSTSPLYGISDAQLVMEIPTENGTTRYVVYKSEIGGLGKIGAISATRDYITAAAKSFGGILVANGNDDITNYSTPPATLHLDLSTRADAVYKENGKNNYTDSRIINDFTKDESIDRESYKKLSLPFSFADHGEEIRCTTSAKRVILPYSDGMETELVYDAVSGEYYLLKGGRYRTDMLNGVNASFTNALILFANSITYELSEGTETVIDVAGGGFGYYVTKGGLVEIKWSVDGNGNLTLRTLSSEELVVNRGTTYISYFKSSIADTVTFE